MYIYCIVRLGSSVVSKLCEKFIYGHFVYVIPEEGVFNMLTPETSESDMDSRNLIDEYRWQQDKHLCYPCTIGQCKCLAGPSCPCP